MTLTNAQMQAMLAALIDIGAPFDPAAVFVGVASAVDDQGADTVLGDLTQGTGAVATRVAITAWGDAHKLADGRWAVDGPIAEFRPASSAEAQSVSYAFIADAGVAGNLLAFDSLNGEVQLPDEFASLTVIWRLTIDPNGRWSANIHFNG